MDNEMMRLAMMVASYNWRGTSIADGAFHILSQVYSPHTYNDGPERKCCRCGKRKSDPPHR